MQSIYDSEMPMPSLAFNPQLCAQIQAGTVGVAIVPFSPQPRIDHDALAADGLYTDEHQLLKAVQLAFNFDWIGRDILPIQLGHAFHLLSLDSSDKWHFLGTGIVEKLSISRIHALTAKELRSCGYRSQADFLRYWAGNMPEVPENTNPWCWLIKFDFKG